MLGSANLAKDTDFKFEEHILWTVRTCHIKIYRKWAWPWSRDP